MKPTRKKFISKTQHISWEHLNKYRIPLVSITYLVITLRYQWAWLVNSGVWAEVGTNYFVLDREEGLFENLTKRDAGYIPLPARAASLIIEAISPNPSVFPVMSTLIATIIPVIIFAAILKLTSKSSEIPFLLQVAFALFLVSFFDFQTRTFINVWYYFPILAFIIFASQDKAKIGISDPPKYLWILPIFVISKPINIFIGIVIAIWLITNYKRSLRKYLLSALFFVASATQTVTLLDSREKGVLPNTNGNFTISTRVLEMFEGFSTYISNPIFAFLPLTIQQNLQLRLLAGVALLALALYLFFSGKRYAVYFISGMILLISNSFLNAFILLGSLPADYPIQISYSRTQVVGFQGGVLVLIYITYELITRKTLGKKQQHGVRAAAILIILLNLISVSEIARPYEFPGTGAYFWKDKAKEFYNSNIVSQSIRPTCIPIDPYGWVAGDTRCLNQPVGYATILNSQYYKFASVYLRPDLPPDQIVDGVQIPIHVDELSRGAQLEVTFILESGERISQSLDLDETSRGPKMVYLRLNNTFKLDELREITLQFPIAVRYFSPSTIPRAATAVVVVFHD